MNARTGPSVLLLSAFLLALPAASAQHDHGAGKLDRATCFFMSDPGSLDLGIPNGSSDQSVQINTGAGVRMNSLGKWSSPPFAADMDYPSGDVNFSVWIRGSGRIQKGTEIHAYFGVNDQQGTSMVMSETAVLSSTPTEVKGSGKQPLTMKKGDSLSVWFYAVESGSGGALLYGSAAHPSYVALGLAPVNISATASKAAGNFVRLTGTVDHLLGMKEVVSVESLLEGPFPKEDLAKTDPSLHYDMFGMSFGKSSKTVVDPSDDGGANIDWKWCYAGAKIRNGYYFVVIRVVDAQNMSWFGYSEPISLSPAPPGTTLDAGTAALIAVVALAAVAGSVITHKRFSGRLRRKRRDATGPSA